MTSIRTWDWSDIATATEWQNERARPATAPKEPRLRASSPIAEQAVSMVRNGATFRQAAKSLGISIGQVSGLIYRSRRAARAGKGQG